MGMDQEIEEAISRLVGKEIWRVGTSAGAANSFSLAIGDRVPRESRLEGNAVDDFSEFRGEFGLYVWCTWRIAAGDDLASSDQSQEVFQHALKRLLLERVIDVQVSGRFRDLTLRTNTCVLQVFCDHMLEDSSFDVNWELEFPGGALSVGPGDRVDAEHLAEVDMSGYRPD